MTSQVWRNITALVALVNAGGPGRQFRGVAKDFCKLGRTPTPTLPLSTGGGGKGRVPQKIMAVPQFRSWGLVGLAIFLFASPVRADEQPPATAVSTTLSSDVVTGEPFPRGLRVITLYGGYEQQPNGTRAQIGFCNVGLNYYFANNWAFGFEATGLGCSQPQDNVGAGGADIILRTHLWNYRRFSFYGDVAVGILEANNRIPPSGTDFNFTIQSGVGAAYRLDEHTEIMFGIRDFHLSNARQDGPNRNPSLNGIQGYMGLMFRR